MSKLMDRLRAWFAPAPQNRVVAPQMQRLYTGARHGAGTYGFGSINTSADAELAGALTTLRSRSRALMRDSAYAKRARTIIVNNVVGAGVGIQAQVLTTRDELAERVNDDIERAFKEWSRADSCHTGGALHFADLERAAMAEVVTAGECFIRRHMRYFGGSKVPYALELIEPERLLDDTVSTLAGIPSNVRMGIEVDEWHRPVAYYIRSRHPGDHRFNRVDQNERVIRVPADEMFHLRIIDRWPQSRGEPWLHACLRKLNDMEQYSASELEAARASSYYFGTIESSEETNPLANTQASGTQPAAMEIESGVVQQLMPGEKMNFHSPSRPNTALDPFLRHMLREMAAGSNVSYESLSRDYSQSNYSSSRLALLDDRDLWRMLQQWWVRSFREPLHREWMRQAVLVRAIPAVPLDAYLTDTARYEAVKWKLRGWSWIDPAKEQAAFEGAVRAGFMTVSDVIAQTGNGADLEDVLKARARELKLMQEYEIEVTTTVKEEEPPKPAPPPEPDDDENQPTSRPARLVSFGGRNG